MKMFTLYNLVISKGIVPQGIKTDAILVDESKEELERLFHFDATVIGGLKFASGKSCAESKVRQHKNDPFDVNQVLVHKVTIHDEYNSNEFKNVFDEMIGENNRMLILGLFPGVGKTTCVTNYKDHKILFVTPFNKLAQQMKVKGHHAVTINKLLGFYGDGQEYVKMNSFDVTAYDCICFDEIMMNSPKILQKIDTFMKQHPAKKFFATGDIDQLQPIDFQPNNVVHVQKYLVDCVNQMFTNQITLTISKRLKTDEQRNSLSQLFRSLERYHSNSKISWI